jgi:4-carboxymuconolactone decarboxylase
MTAITPRIAPLEPPYEPEVAASLAKWMPPGSPAEPLRLFRMLMVSPELAGRMRPLGAAILGSKSTVPGRLREVLIHRTCALTGAEYEWGVHVAGFGRPLGFSEEQLCSTVHGSFQDGCWDAEQSSVFRLADELHTTSTVSDELWRALAATFATEQILELLVTAGWYHVIAYLCNGAGLEGEPWAATFEEVGSVAGAGARQGVHPAAPGIS